MARTAEAGPVLVCSLLFGLSPVSPPAPPLPESVARCLPCHHGEEGEQVEEWLASPYSEGEGGRGCLACHPPRCRGTADPNLAAEAPDPRSLRRSVRLTLTAACGEGAVEAEVAVSNIGVGHDFPSGSDRRTLVLEVAARDREGRRLPRLARSAELVPRATDRASGRIVFVRRRPEGDPTFRDRLSPFATDVSRFRFASPEEGAAQVTARLALLSPPDPAVEIANTTVVCARTEEEEGPPRGSADRQRRP